MEQIKSFKEFTIESLTILNAMLSDIANSKNVEETIKPIKAVAQVEESGIFKDQGYRVMVGDCLGHINTCTKEKLFDLDYLGISESPKHFEDALELINNQTNEYLVEHCDGWWNDVDDLNSSLENYERYFNTK